jgi:hypothetical protein
MGVICFIVQHADATAIVKGTKIDFSMELCSVMDMTGLSL